jgi:hypothetical protein
MVGWLTDTDNRSDRLIRQHASFRSLVNELPIHYAPV